MAALAVAPEEAEHEASFTVEIEVDRATSESITISWSVDRAEPSQHEQKRPDTPYVRQFGNNTVCWPTKLTLVPLLGDMEEKLLQFVPVKDPQINLGEPVRFANAPWATKK